MIDAGPAGTVPRMPDFRRETPLGDTKERLVCASCHYVAYDNPKIVAGAVVSHAGSVLLCRRAIEPRHGYWTLPAGYLETGETPEEGARREAAEEACATIELDGLLAVYSVARIDQVQLIYRGRFVGLPSIAAGVESLETRMFAWDEIPWSELAFPTVAWALRAWRVGADLPLGAPAGNPESDPRGTARLPEVVA